MMKGPPWAAPRATKNENACEETRALEENRLLEEDGFVVFILSGESVHSALALRSGEGQTFTVLRIRTFARLFLRGLPRRHRMLTLNPRRHPIESDEL